MNGKLEPQTPDEIKKPSSFEGGRASGSSEHEHKLKAIVRCLKCSFVRDIEVEASTVDYKDNYVKLSDVEKIYKKLWNDVDNMSAESFIVQACLDDFIRATRQLAETKVMV